MKFRAQIFYFLVATSWAVPTLGAKRNCADAVGAFAPRQRGGGEDEYLAAFEPKKIVLRKVRHLSTMDTFEALDDQGRRFVVRLSGEEGDNPYFEKLASNFFHAAPNVDTPAVRLLDDDVSEAITQRLGDRVSFAQHGPATVAAFYTDLESGEVILRKLGINNMSKLADIKKLSNAALNHSISDHWAMRELLGIQDFNADNWGKRNGKFMSIDLALANPTFKQGLDRIVSQGINPYGVYFIAQSDEAVEMDKFLLKNISPKMLAYLESLDAAQVKRLAEQSDFPILEREVAGVVKRAKQLVDEARAIKAKPNAVPASPPKLLEEEVRPSRHAA